MNTEAKAGLWFGALAGGAAVAILVGLAPAPEPTITCYEDEVIVWTEEAHDACVPLDALWYDPETKTVHWFAEDER